MMAVSRLGLRHAKRRLSIGGPLVVDINGLELTKEDREFLLHPAVGMVILFARNFASVQQVRQLTSSIRTLRSEPLMIAVDHEGGRVQRFKEGFTPIPPMATLGHCWMHDAMRAIRAAWAVGYVIGHELRQVGVDLSFTPVLDLDWRRSAVIGDRALHPDSRVVTMLASQLMHGLAAAGISHCGKHFPGHGWVEADSHIDLPRDERSLETILSADAQPYAAMGPSLAAVMPAHVVYPMVDAMPAGFSRIWLQDILRDRLGFTGAVFSDDLSMQGAAAVGDVHARCAAALSAGCDFLLVCNDRSAAVDAASALPWQATASFEARVKRLRPTFGNPLSQLKPSSATFNTNAIYPAAQKLVSELA